MKVYLLKDVEAGPAGKIVNVSDGYAMNFLLPRKLAVEVTRENEKSFAQRQKVLDVQQKLVEEKSSLLAQKVKGLKVVIKAKAHHEADATGKLYGALGAAEVVAALAQEGVIVAKSQIVFDKAIKTVGVHTVTVKLSNKLQPQCTIKVVAEC